MAPSPQKFREIVFQLLFSCAFAETDAEDVASFMMHEHAITKKVLYTALEERGRIEEKKEEIDRIITESSKMYAFERIGRTELAILRLGIYELLYAPAVPPKVAISEAIRLCRKFASPEGSAFVNAIMDKVKNELPAGQTA